MARILAFVAAAAPVAISAACVAVFLDPRTEGAGMAWVRENGPAETASFVALLAAGILAGVAAVRARRRREPRALVLGLCVCAVLGVAAGFEEISWGQSLLHYASPPGWERVNVQDEINVHNLEGVQDLHSFLLFAFGICGGIAATILERRGRPALRVPRVAVPYFAVIAVLGGLDWLTDNVPIEPNFDRIVGRLVEVNELFVALALLIWAAAVAGRLRSTGATAG